MLARLGAEESLEAISEVQAATGHMAPNDLKTYSRELGQRASRGKVRVTGRRERTPEEMAAMWKLLGVDSSERGAGGPEK
jgi:hypothetical protein